MHIKQLAQCPRSLKAHFFAFPVLGSPWLRWLLHSPNVLLSVTWEGLQTSVRAFMCLVRVCVWGGEHCVPKRMCWKDRAMSIFVGLLKDKGLLV